MKDIENLKIEDYQHTNLLMTDRRMLISDQWQYGYKLKAQS